MTSNDSSHDTAKCPLCGQLNECQLCTAAVYKGPCWCARISIPDELLACVPTEHRNKACLCRNCVMEFHRAQGGGVAGPEVRPGDFYFDNGLMVFTEAYHLRRGYCCDSGCRHCPYSDGNTRPHPGPLPSVFAPLRRDRAKAKGEGGQERENHSPSSTRSEATF